MKTTTKTAGLAACALFAGAALPALAQQLPGERPANVTEIPGVVAAGANWELVWADFKTADGMVGTAYTRPPVLPELRRTDPSGHRRSPSDSADQQLPRRQAVGAAE